MTTLVNAAEFRRPWRVDTLDLLVPAILLLAVLPGGVYVSLLLAVALMFAGRVPDALAATVMLTLANPALFDVEIMGLGRYIPLFIGLGLLWSGPRVAGLWVGWAMLCCAVLIAFSAVAVSLLPSISLFKGTLFIMVLWVLFHTDRVDWPAFASRVDRFIPLYVLLSLPFLAIPSIGFKVNGTGFQGLTVQPQVFGVWMALAAAWLLYRSWARQCALPRPLSIVVIAVLLGCILLSEARTALLGFSAAAVATTLVMIFRSPTNFGLRLLMGMAVAALSVTAAQNNATLENFLFKRSQMSDIVGAVQASRGFLVERSLENFRAHPILGIGFGVPSNPATAEITYAPVINMPISVPVEKGVWVTAALEEQGALGMLALISLYLSLLSYAIMRRSWMGIPMIFYFLTSNLAEMTMFSMGGTGLLQWLLLMASLKLTESPVARPSPVLHGGRP